MRCKERLHFPIEVNVARSEKPLFTQPVFRWADGGKVFTRLSLGGSFPWCSGRRATPWGMPCLAPAFEYTI